MEFAKIDSSIVVRRYRNFPPAWELPFRSHARQFWGHETQMSDIYFPVKQIAEHLHKVRATQKGR